MRCHRDPAATLFASGEEACPRLRRDHRGLRAGGDHRGSALDRLAPTPNTFSPELALSLSTGCRLAVDWPTVNRPGRGDGAWNRTLGEAQYRWLQRTLAADRSAYRFIFIHHLVGGDDQGRGGVERAGYFEWGGRNSDGSDGFAAHRPGWAMPIHDLLVAHHVTAVFHGHDHFYARQELDGIVYQLVPQPAHHGRRNSGPAAGYSYRSGDILDGSGHLRVRVAPAAATVEFVRAVLPADERRNGANGQVAQRYELPPRPPGP